MRTISNGFGGTNEGAMIDQFIALHGSAVLDALDRLVKSSYPGIRVSPFDKPKTAREVFEERAKRDGHSAEAIRDFKQLL